MNERWNAMHVMIICTLSMIHFTEKISSWDYKIKTHAYGDADCFAMSSW